jgi:hypothetical protein
VAEHVAAMAIADTDKPGLSFVHPEDGPILLRVVKMRCEQDRWSDEAKTCYLAAKPRASLNPCDAKLTGEQLSNVKIAMETEQTARRSPPDTADASASAGSAVGQAVRIDHAEPAAPAVPVAPAAHVVPPLSAYVGKYPNEKVQGIAFLQHPTVLAGVRKAVPASDGNIRNWVLAADASLVPIDALGGRVVAHACEPHNCGPHQWSIVVDPNSGAADVCYHDEETIGTYKSFWYLASGKKEVRDVDGITGGCPSRGN